MKQYISLMSIFVITLFAMLACSTTVDADAGIGDKDNKEPEKEREENGSGETNGYKIVWQDLFNGKELDAKNWYVEVNGDGGGNAELQYYRNENISVGKEPVTERSCLVITAKKENYKGKRLRQVD